MRFHVLCRRGAIMALALLATAPLVSQAGYVLVTSRAALGGSDYIDWGTLGPSYSLV